jgi:hypothetical protein
MSAVERLVQEARALPPEELRQLIEALSHDAEPRPTISEEEFQAHLLKAGIISELPQPLVERQASNFQPIVVRGKPLSETIIEESRS